MIDVGAGRRATSVTALLLLALAGSAAGQEGPLDGLEPPARELPPPADSAGTAAAYTAMRTLFEKTIFQVDVLTLEVWIGGAAGSRLRELGTRAEYTDPLADSVADIAANATDAWARIRFRRDVGLDQFLDGAADNLERARDAGFIDAASFDAIASDMPGWYTFLSGRGIKDGDTMIYRIRGDTLRTVYRAYDGTPMLDQVDVGPERRRAVLGSYFARDADFRKGLVRSLLR